MTPLIIKSQAFHLFAIQHLPFYLRCHLILGKDSDISLNHVRLLNATTNLLIKYAVELNQFPNISEISRYSKMIIGLVNRYCTSYFSSTKEHSGNDLCRYGIFESHELFFGKIYLHSLILFYSGAGLPATGHTFENFVKTITIDNSEIEHEINEKENDDDDDTASDSDSDFEETYMYRRSRSCEFSSENNIDTFSDKLYSEDTTNNYARLSSETKACLLCHVKHIDSSTIEPDYVD